MKFIVIVGLVLLGLAFAQSDKDWYSNRLFVGNGLKVGYELESSGMLNEKGRDFPSGFQFFYLTSFQLGVSDKVKKLKALADRVERYQLRFHLILTAQNTISQRAESGERFPSTYKQLESDPSFVFVNQGWGVWLDLNERLADLTAAKGEAFGRVTRGPTSLFGCAKDGKVISSYRDYAIFENPNRLLETIADCLAGQIGLQRVAIGFQTGEKAAFVLKSETGVVVRQADAKQPFAVLVTPPSGVYQNSAKEAVQMAFEILKDAKSKIPVYVLALEQVADFKTKTFKNAKQIASQLRVELNTPVFEDTTDTFIDRYSLHLWSPFTLILFNASGVPVDAYFF